MTKALSIRVYGKVQGVNYRLFAYRLAQELNLMGWVENKDDGTVQLHAEGDESQLKNLVDGLRIGPIQARVDKLELSQIDSFNCHEFIIKK